MRLILAAALSLALGIMALVQPWVLLGLLALPIAARGVRVVRSGATGRALIPVLASTGLYEVAWALLVLVGVAVAPTLA